MAKQTITQKARTSDEIRANMDLAGIPDSKPFVTDEPVLSGVSKILSCHISGVLISDLNLDPQVLSALDYWATDEGAEEKNSRPEVREPSGITLGADSFDKSLEQRRDDVKERDMDLYDARDPLKEVATRHAVPGMRAKFLSEKKVKENGGSGDYEVVKDAAGDPVKVRGLVLGHMPERRANARNRHFRERGNQMLKQIEESAKREGLVSDQS